MSVAKRSLFGKSKTASLVILRNKDKDKDPDKDKVRPILRFGIMRAKAIVTHFDDIKRFVKDIERSQQPEETDEQRNQNHPLRDK